MTSLAPLRFVAAGGLALAAGLVGLVTSPRTGPAEPAPSASVVEGPRPLRASDISALSARLLATGLFPAATALPSANTPQQASAGTGELAVVQPPIAALVREGGVWRLHAGGTMTGMSRLVVGDELFDGWRVEEISATRIVLERDGEIRSVDLFVEP